MEKLRFYTDNIGPVAENESASLKKVIDLSRELKEINQIIILIHTKNNTGYIDRTIGAKYLKGLFQGSVSVFKGGPTMKLETLNTFGKSYGYQQKNVILLAFGLGSKELFKYDDNQYIKAIVAHQWSEGGVREWANAWGATELISGKEQQDKELPDKIVREAFIELSGSINLSTGITHPMDNERCKTYLRALQKYNYELNPVEINTLLLSELGWTSRYAEDVIKLVNTLNEGRFFKGGEKTGLQNHIKRWKSI